MELVSALETTMTRDTVINVLLIIAGVVLAIALFGAGVVWKSRTAKGSSSLSSAHFDFRARTGHSSNRISKFCRVITAGDRRHIAAANCWF